MADTGAPWNIPYVEPTDNPRVYPAADEAQALAIAAGLSAAGNAGIGSNVVQTVKTDTFSSSSTTFTNITGLAATITPTSTSSLVLVTLHIGTVDQSGDNNIFGDCTRDTTPIGIGAAEGSRGVAGWAASTNAANRPKVASWSFLDAPNKDTATVYQARIRVAGGSAFVNRSSSDGDSSGNPRTISTLTLIEVAP